MTNFTSFEPSKLPPQPSLEPKLLPPLSHRTSASHATPHIPIDLAISQPRLIHQRENLLLQKLPHAVLPPGLVGEEGDQTRALVDGVAGADDAVEGVQVLRNGGRALETVVVAVARGVLAGVGVEGEDGAPAAVGVGFEVEEALIGVCFVSESMDGVEWGLIGARKGSGGDWVRCGAVAYRRNLGLLDHWSFGGIAGCGQWRTNPG